MRVLCDVTLKKETDKNATFALVQVDDPALMTVKVVVNKDTEGYRSLRHCVVNHKPAAVEITIT